MWTVGISGSRLWLPGKVVEVALVHAVWAVRHCDLDYINSVQTLQFISIKRWSVQAKLCTGQTVANAHSLPQCWLFGGMTDSSFTPSGRFTARQLERARVLCVVKSANQTLEDANTSYEGMTAPINPSALPYFTFTL